MGDHLSAQGRSRNMAAIRAKDTKPELALRQALWRGGVRGWRCHVRAVPGNPDLAFTRCKVAVFVDGAYWHGHPDHIRPGASEYWRAKIARTQERDRAANAALVTDGWTVLRFWDFQIARELDRCVDSVKAAVQAARESPTASALSPAGRSRRARSPRATAPNS